MAPAVYGQQRFNLFEKRYVNRVRRDMPRKLSDATPMMYVLNSTTNIEKSQSVHSICTRYLKMIYQKLNQMKQTNADGFDHENLKSTKKLTYHTFYGYGSRSVDSVDV